MKDESYNGYSNRETWAVSLWFHNTEVLCNEILPSICREAEMCKHTAARLLEDFATNGVEEFFTPEEYKSYCKEVGSFWRVDWLEIMAAEIADYHNNQGDSHATRRA